MEYANLSHKKLHFCILCVKIIHFSPQIGRIVRICDEGNNWQQLANNYFIALLREAGNEVSICQKRSKMIQKKLFSLRAITRSSRRTKEMSAHECARRDGIGKGVEPGYNLRKRCQVGRWEGGIRFRRNRQSEIEARAWWLALGLLGGITPWSGQMNVELVYCV